MLEQHAAHPYSYNEVVLDAAVWKQLLPRTVQAFFFVAGSQIGEAKARRLYADFVQMYPKTEAILVSMDLKLFAPFERVDPSPGLIRGYTGR